MSLIQKALASSYTVLVGRMHEYVLQQQLKLAGNEDAKHAGIIADAERCIAHYEEVVRQHRDRNARRRDTGKYHPSGLHGCLRAVWFNVNRAAKTRPISGEDEARKQMIFRNGDYVHLRLQNLLDEMGVLERRELPLERPDLNMEGHADGVLRIDGKRYVLEIKSINERGFLALKEPKGDHRFQMECYMLMSKIPRALILYECKNTQKWKEYVIEMTPEAEQEILRRVAVLKKHVKSPPDRPVKMPSECRCDFLHVCWSDDKLAEFQKTRKGKTHEGHAAVAETRNARRIVVRKADGAGSPKADSGDAFRRWFAKR